MSKPTTPRTPPSFAALVQAFFTEHLTQQRALSPHTVATYRDAFVLFLDFTVDRLHKQPTAIRLDDITPALILAFLDHLEHERGNAVRTRNARLAALRAFLKFAGHRDVGSFRARRCWQSLASRDQAGPTSATTSCCTCFTTPAQGCRRSSACAWPMSCSMARHACTCMARDASSEQCRCGGPRSRRYGRG
jgi:Phage integrase, N-terminal SAM-like domain